MKYEPVEVSFKNLFLKSLELALPTVAIPMYVALLVIVDRADSKVLLSFGLIYSTAFLTNFLTKEEWK